MTDKERLTVAFKALRRAGFKAYQNFQCCQSCAGALICERFPDEKDRQNVVFYHAQDRQSGFMKRDPHAISKDGLYLAWQGDAQKIVDELKAVGLNVEWNGSPDVRILVKSAA